LTQQHYKWSSRDQRWKPDRIELALIISAVALLTGLLAIAMAMR
jgi:hypothetical protein